MPFHPRHPIRRGPSYRILISRIGNILFCRLKELTAKLDEVTLERDKANKQLNTSAAEIESLKTSLKALSVLEKARDAADDSTFFNQSVSVETTFTNSFSVVERAW